MAYIEESFKPEDQERIGIDALVNKHFSRRKPAYWVIDRETGNYSIAVFGHRPDRDERYNEIDYIYSWHGHMFDCFTIAWKQNREPNSIYYWWFVVEPRLPAELELFRKEIFDDFQKTIAANQSKPFVLTQFIQTTKG